MQPSNQTDFEKVLAQLRAEAESTVDKGKRFERLMKRYFEIDPLYRDRFEKVWLWNDWPGRGNVPDTGIDLVAQERDGGVCAIQCKFYERETAIGKDGINSFISASNREPFTARLLVNTGADLGKHAKTTIGGLQPPMQILRFGDLVDQPIHWPDALAKPEKLQLRPVRFGLQEHQQTAVDDVVQKFKESPRGRLIMPCGTGKTFTALKIAESVAGRGGRVLYLVPSIALLGQTMREWVTQKSLGHRYIGICSDAQAGKNSEDASISELEIPVTTDRDTIRAALRKDRPQNLTVVFCTYHSLPIIAEAQAGGAPDFDLALCDEAHRTTGVEKPGDKLSPFVLIHDAEKIRAKHRLYMTATPRIYAEQAKTKAKDGDIGLFSMDDEKQYGPEFYRMEFSEAIEQDLLSDYRVLVLNIGEQHVTTVLQSMLAHAEGGSELNLDDAGRMLGCWRALEEPEGLGKQTAAGPLRRAIAFTNRIDDSKLMAKNWQQLVEQAIALQPEEKRAGMLRCEVQHVDGKQNAFLRKERIDWLKRESGDACRILSNARCLSEGVDVPALDAVLFMQPRRAQIDVVQAVGRVMRKSAGKEYGYIILPIVIPVDQDPAAALDDNERYQTVWDVLRALRSHDNRFNDEINRLDLNEKPPDRVKVIGIDTDGGDGDSEPETMRLPLVFSDLPMDAFYAKVVEKCGDRQYWETWAKDIADIVSHLIARINALLEKESADAVASSVSAHFSAFLAELRASINESVSRDDAVAMVAQHMITGPVFNALFENYDFANSNPVARALSNLVALLDAHGLDTEIRDLGKFYESVRRRAQGLDNPKAKQRVLVELYEKFFKVALPRETARLGIAYTPPEVVDFILHSADHVMRGEFGRGLTDRDVHIMDPFTGTGIFLARLLQSGLIRDADLARKFRQEMHANEIVLLAYYIAAVNIEEAFHARRGAADYESFPGIVLCDTFRLADEDAQIPGAVMPDNDARRKRQRGARIEVVVGNPPYSAGQRSADDNNPNVDYPAMEKRVSETYAVRSTTTNRNSLYDTYKMAIRWATDRIGDAGVVAFVTNGSFIDGNVDAGLRACLADEFDSIYIFNLRGKGVLGKTEGQNVFQNVWRVPIAITVLVKNSGETRKPCRILYKDIGKNLNRKQKLSLIQKARSVSGIPDWDGINPDDNHDWINQRDADYRGFIAIGDPVVKRNKSDDAIFRLYSAGAKTGRDGWLCNFSKEALAIQTKRMTDAYERVRREIIAQRNSSVEDAVDSEDDKINWNSEILQRLSRGTPAPDLPHAVRHVTYRPFVKCCLAFNLPYIQRSYQIPQVFPESDSENLVICVTGKGTTKPFSALMVDTTPDIQLLSNGQCFPLHRYEIVKYADRTIPGMPHEREKRDNILDQTRARFRLHYADNDISKEDIFHYVYGLLHAPDYKARYRNDLAKDLPRIPFAPDFRAFAEAGRKLGDLHVNFDACKRHPLNVQFTGTGDAHYRLTAKKMRFAKDDNSVLVVNDHLRIGGIPAAAHEYQVNGRTPLGWFIDRYRITIDKKSGNKNDPNAWFAKPDDFIAAVERIVHTSAQTARIIQALPPALED